MPKGIRLWTDFHVLVIFSLFKIYQLFEPAYTNRNTGEKSPRGWKIPYSSSHVPHLMSHTPLSLPLLGTCPKAIPAGLKALTESCFAAAGSANPLASPNPILPRDTQLGSTASDPAVGGAAPITCPSRQSRA